MGPAFADLDGDGDLDAYIIQSGSLYPQEPGTVLPGNELYLNRGDGVFDKVADGGGAADNGYGMGVAAGDYDNDGDIDLYVTNVGANALLRNDGTGRFEDVTEAAGVGDPGWSTGAAFLDLDADGDLDLYVVNYINWSVESEIRCYVGNLLTYCPPANYNAPAVDTLYRNDGDGTFTDVSVESGIASGFRQRLWLGRRRLHRQRPHRPLRRQRHDARPVLGQRGRPSFHGPSDAVGQRRGRARSRQGRHGRFRRRHRQRRRHGHDGGEPRRPDRLVLPQRARLFPRCHRRAWARHHGPASPALA